MLTSLQDRQDPGHNDVLCGRPPTVAVLLELLEKKREMSWLLPGSTVFVAFGITPSNTTVSKATVPIFRAFESYRPTDLYLLGSLC